MPWIELGITSYKYFLHFIFIMNNIRHVYIFKRDFKMPKDDALSRNLQDLRIIKDAWSHEDPLDLRPVDKWFIDTSDMDGRADQKINLFFENPERFEKPDLLRHFKEINSNENNLFEFKKDPILDIQTYLENVRRLSVPRMSVTGNTYVWQANVTRDSVRVIDGGIEIRDSSNPERVSQTFNNAVTGLPRVLTPKGWETDLATVGCMHGVYTLEKAPA